MKTLEVLPGVEVRNGKILLNGEMVLRVEGRKLTDGKRVIARGDIPELEDAAFDYLEGLIIRGGLDMRRAAELLELPVCRIADAPVTFPCQIRELLQCIQDGSVTVPAGYTPPDRAIARAGLEEYYDGLLQEITG